MNKYERFFNRNKPKAAEAELRIALGEQPGHLYRNGWTDAEIHGMLRRVHPSRFSKKRSSNTFLYYNITVDTLRRVVDGWKLHDSGAKCEKCPVYFEYE